MFNLSETRARRLRGLLLGLHARYSGCWEGADERPRSASKRSSSHSDYEQKDGQAGSLVRPPGILDRFLSFLSPSPAPPLPLPASPYEAARGPIDRWPQWVRWIEPCVLEKLMVAQARWILPYWMEEGGDLRPRNTVEALEAYVDQGRIPGDWQSVLESPLIPFNDCRVGYLAGASDCIAWAAHYVHSGDAHSAACSFSGAYLCVTECRDPGPWLHWLGDTLVDCYAQARARRGEA